MNGIPWLTVLWLAPAVGAAAVLMVPGGRHTYAKYVGLGATLTPLVVSAVLIAGFDTAGKQYQFVENHDWIPSFGAGYTLGLDGIALSMVVLTAGLVPLLIVAGWNDAPARGRAVHTYFALILVVESMALLTFVALDVLLFYVMFEAILIPTYLLIGRFGGPDRSRAALKFLLYNLAGGLVMLAAVIGLYVVSAPAGAGFDIRELVAGAHGSSATTRLLFGGFMFAFAVKAPMWPLHTWLPDVATAAKPATAVLIMAIVDKIGTFGMMRYCLQLFPDAATYFRPVIVALSVMAILYGALVAIGQTDVMRLIAFASLSHFGFITLGVFAMTSQGQAGAILYMVNHGVSTAALLLTAGFLVSRGRTRSIDGYGGVRQLAPLLAGTFLVAGLASLALPGLAPFISEFLVLIGTFTQYPAVAVCAALALILSAVYILWMYQRIMTGPVSDSSRRVDDLRPRELAVVAPLLAVLLGLGIYPKPLLDMVESTVAHTLTVVGQHDPVPTAAEGTYR
ncbi:NADH-quinone oxidoreductase subunit M [Mycolicibacterium fluoranthenivorans]|uniref:NADH dehydrogenase subunit M n=1 Tax=Mycolicibacterium fluoranthenivorans TaxID=258505 RepID=A0A1G4WZ15_9MYCO|nr:NADH-quinone oxidoreductase subunit M [Mycolicibacterium fluoranthenivorans]SCX32649.1 NADH dehydrogenase subunit M [Mycolicibacterium fluoranthenivorans]